jgi:hypothetical protein
MLDHGSPRRSPLRLILAAGLILVGLIFIGQGLGILTTARSVMVGDPKWAVIGAACVGVGIVLVVRARRA